MDGRGSTKRRKLNHSNRPDARTLFNTHDDAVVQQQPRKTEDGSATKPTADVDAYDDIEGAHIHDEETLLNLPVKSRGPLDPLRNQKTQSNTQSPSKRVASLSFFKQFSSPVKSPPETPKKDESRRSKTLGERDVEVGMKTNGTNREEVTPAKETAGNGTMQDEAGRSSGRQRKKPTRYENGVVPSASNSAKKTSSSRRKTAEEEMQEVQQAAQEQVVGEQAGEDSPKSSSKRQRISRAKKEEDPVPRQTPRKARTPKKAQTLQGDTVVLEGVESVEQDDPMEIDTVPVMSTKPDHDHPQTPAKTQSKNTAETMRQLHDTTFTSDELQLIQHNLLEVISGERPNRLRHLDTEYSKVSNLVTQTVTAGESNSMLLIGTRGSGKSTMINHILRELTASHPDDFHVIRLNGFIHTDDKIAVREIWRQLGREMEVEDDSDNGRTKNIADTMTTLLALLSHPAEQGREQESGQITKSVIFILDEFELFAMHPRQTLLYNLFDIAQSRKAPIAVLGLTSRVDVAETLEKRVKSRFSHRYVHLSLAKSLASFQEACRFALTPDFKVEKGDEYHSHGEQDLPDRWSGFLDQLFASSTLNNHFNRIYYTTKSIPEFLTSVLLPVSTIPIDREVTSSDLSTHFCTYLSSALHPDSKISLLSSFSIVQLALLICAARLVAIHNVEAVSFGLAYEEYKILASKAKIQASASGALAQGAGVRVWGKSVARGAWRELESSGAIMSDGSTGPIAKCRIDIGLEEIGASGVDLGAWGRWCKEI